MEAPNAKTNGILGAWATVGGSDFATNSGLGGGLIVAYTGYTDVPRLTPGTIVSDATSNVRIIEGSGSPGDITMAASGTTAINSLLQSASGGTSAASVVIGAGNTLQVNGILQAPTAGSLTIGVPTTTAQLQAGSAGGTLDLSNYSTNALTVNAAITDNTSASSLTLGGTGTVVLTGVNLYTGTTGINGTLQVAGSGSLGSGSYAGAIGNNGVLQYSSSAAQTLSGVISGSGSLTKDTSGSTLTLTAFNPYTGATTIGAGTLQIGGTGSLGSFGSYAGAISIASGATFEYSSSAAQTLSGAITGLGALTLDNSGTATSLTLTGTGNTYSGNTAISNGNRLVAGPANLSPNTAFNIAGTSAGGGQLYFNAGAATVANNFTISGVGYADRSGVRGSHPGV